ncbi:MAG: glycosyltransferase, partial [Endomicrobiia bacterium]
MLLNGEIKNDSRVINVIKSISRFHEIDLFYISNENVSNKVLGFNEKVKLIPKELSQNYFRKIIKNTLFYNEYNFFATEVLKKTIKYDFIYANDLPCLKPAINIKEKTGSKVIYDSHEIYIETINQFFPQKAKFYRKIIYKILQKFMRIFGTFAEKKMLRNVDYFITVGEGLKEYFEKKYNFKGIKVIMNCPYFIKVNEKINYFDFLNIDKQSFILLYQGVLNEGRGLKLLIEAMRFAEEKVFLIIIGDGLLEKELKELVKKYNLQNRILFLGKIPQNELRKFTAGADCGLNLLEKLNKSKELAAPNKLFQYIHANIPVIASYSYENNKVFEKYKIGLQTENNIYSISDSINKIANMDRKIFIENCKKAALEYNWENQEKVL